MNTIRKQMTLFVPVKGALSLMALLAILGGCAADRYGTAVQEQPTRVADTSIHNDSVMEYRIGPADVLSISVWNHKEMNQTVTVRPDGHISFPLTGDIEAVGLTPLELQEAMETALGKYIDLIPGEVSVVVDAVHSYKVSVLGEVHRPGQYEFQSQATVLDALAQAGGLTEFATRSDILILHSNGGQLEKQHFDYRQLVKTGNSATRILVFPGDVVLVQ